MNFHGTGRSKATQKQLSELLHPVTGLVTRIITQFFLTLSYSQAQTLLKNLPMILEKIRAELPAMLVLNPDTYSETRAYWEHIYATKFGLDADFSGVWVPEEPTEGVWRLLFILQGLTLHHMLQIYRRIITAYHPPWRLAEDLGKVISYNARTSAASYAVWVRNDPETDEEFQNLSVQQADPDRLIGETALERAVHGVIHFIETKEHLDSKGITMCSGSRSADGLVPGVYWDYRNLRVVMRLYGPDSLERGGGVRRVISLPQAV